MSIELMSHVWKHFPRGGGEKLVLLALADWGGDDGDRIWPSVATVAQKTNMSERQVQRILSGFVNDGILTIVANEKGGRNITRHYRINIAILKGDIMSHAGPERVTSETLKGDICDIKGDTGDAKGDAHVTRTVINHQENHQEEPLKDIPAFAENENPESSIAESLSTFDKFWDIYPKQRAGSKPKALIAYQKAVRRGHAPVVLLSGVTAYAKSDEVAKGFAKGCAAWLNDDRFLNDYNQKGQSNEADRRNHTINPTTTDRLAAVLEQAKRNIDAGITGFGWATPDGGNAHAMLPGPEPVRQAARTIGGGDSAVSDGFG